MKTSYLHTLLCTLTIIMGSCSLPSQKNIIPESPTQKPQLSPTEQNTATPINLTTPEITRAPTPTKIPAILRTWGNYPGPTIYPPIEIPPPVDLIDKPPEQTNILLLGDDQRPNESGLRTDSIMIISVNTTKNAISLISFPRDLYVYAPGWTMQRINVIYQRGGFDLLALTFAYNFGVNLDYYMRVNVFTLQELINQLNGIDVNVAYPMSDEDPLLHGIRSIPVGIGHMNGATAAWYCRARYATSDFDRARRHQEVLQALFQRLLSYDLLRQAPELYNQFSKAVSTNMTFENIARFIPYAFKVKNKLPLRQYLIGKSQVTEWTVPTDGSKVLLPIKDAIRLLMLQAFEA